MYYILYIIYYILYIIYYILDIRYYILYNMGPAELDDRELGYIDLLCSALFFLLDSCFLLCSFFFFVLCSFFFLLSSLFLLLPSWLILTPQTPPPRLSRKKKKKGTNEPGRKPSMWSILWRKDNYILVGSFWPRVQLFM